MSDKKNIDKLFQEKFKNLEVTPDDSVWESIEADLHKKKKDRKVIPLWWKLSGIAAGLVILIIAGKYFSNSNSSNSNSNEILVETPIIDNDSITNPLKNNSKPLNIELVNGQQEDSIFNEILSKPKLSNQNRSTQLSQTNKNLSSEESNNLNSESLKLNQNTVASNQSNTSTNTSTKASNKSDLANSRAKKNFVEDVVHNTDKALTNTSTEVSTTSEENLKEETGLDEVISEEKNAIEEAVAQNEEKEKENIEDDAIKRWSVNPNIAPVYYSSIGDGSSIDAQFSENPKSGQVNMSYGVNASYAINKKLFVRAGVNKVNLGYSTNDVAVLTRTPSTALSEANMYKNIAFKSTEAGLISFMNLNQESLSQQSPRALPNQINGQIDQELGYIEIPLELEYKLLDKKFGMSLLGGFSTLFLNDNDIYSVLDGEKTLIGKATNVNDTSFSANLGIGLNYNFSKQFNINIEPTFKYQLDSFENTSGDFNPYFIGVYTGIKYKF